MLPVVTWVMISSYNFYSSGHQATIPSIRFEAAFVGLPGDMGNFILPGELRHRQPNFRIVGWIPTGGLLAVPGLNFVIKRAALNML